MTSGTLGDSGHALTKQPASVRIYITSTQMRGSVLDLNVDPFKGCTRIQDIFVKVGKWRDSHCGLQLLG